MSIFKVLSEFATPGVVAQIARMLGLTDGAATKAIAAAAPTILAAIVNAGSSKLGGDAFANALSRQSPTALTDLADGISRGNRAVAAGGSDMLSTIIGGGQLGVLASRLKEFAGLPEGSSSSLLGLVGSMVMGAVNSEARANKLDAAGALSWLMGQKDDIARAIPKDLATSLKGSGLLEAFGDRFDLFGADVPSLDRAAETASAAAATVRSAVETTAAAASGVAASAAGAARGAARATSLTEGWLPWGAAAVAALLLGWFAWSYFGGDVEQAARDAGSAAVDTAREAGQAATDAAASAASLVVGGVDLGVEAKGIVDRLTASLKGVVDATTAQSAATSLPAIRDDLAELATTAEQLPAAARPTLAALVAAALPTIRAAADAALTAAGPDSPIKPVVDDILARLDAFAKA